MKIAFSRLNHTAYPFKFNLENTFFEGELTKTKPNLAELKMNMQGFVYRPCDSCGEEIELHIDENLKLFLSDGIFKDKDNKLSDTLEFFDGQIDLLELSISELESYLSDYFYCQECKNKF